MAFTCDSQMATMPLIKFRQFMIKGWIRLKQDFVFLKCHTCGWLDGQSLLRRLPPQVSELNSDLGECLVKLLK